MPASSSFPASGRSPWSASWSPAAGSPRSTSSPIRPSSAASALHRSHGPLLDNRPMDEFFVDLPKTRLFVRAWGGPDSRPVVYWHGVNIRARASMAVNEAGPLLAEHGLRILALDAPGFGSSPALDPPAYHPRVLSGLVPELLDALEIERAPHVGFSWGGDIGC